MNTTHAMSFLARATAVTVMATIALATLTNRCPVDPFAKYWGAVRTIRSTAERFEPGPVQAGDNEVAPKSPAVTFSHSIGDLLLDPTDLAQPGVKLAPLFSGLDGEDLRTSVMENVAVGTWEQDGRVTTLYRGALLVTHNRHAHVRLQEYLDYLRAFYSPLPEDGIPGGPVPRFMAEVEEPPAQLMASLDSLRLTMSLADKELAAIADVIQRVSRVNILLAQELQDALAEEEVRVTIEVKNVTIRQTLDEIASTIPMRWYIADGVVVLDTPKAAEGRRRAFELFDIRALVLPPRVVPLDATDLDQRLLVHLEGDDKDMLTADALAAFIQGNLDSTSWDEDPAFSLRISRRGVLEVHQTLAVLDQLREWLEDLEAIVTR